MTLLRQLILIIVALFVLLFAGTFAISVHNTRAYLAGQLATVAQDTATSLGLTLSPHFAANEMVVVESTVSAVFDSGTYREVSIRRLDGQTIVERLAADRIEAVPAWFIRLFPLDTPRGEALIMAGWQQAGTVAVAASPGQAHLALWTNALESFVWFLGASLATSLLGVLALHVVLRPLRAVEAQARAICARAYPVHSPIPRTPELRRVVEAMNRMSRKVKEMFDEQAETIERIRAENFRDPVSGLANRRYFDLQLRHLLARRERFPGGALILLEIRDLKQVNEQEGFPRGDALLAGVGKLIRERCAKLGDSEHFAAHIAGADFAVALADATDKDAEEFVAALMQALPGLHDSGLTAAVDIGHAGVALYGGQSVGAFLAAADTALRAAQNKGANSWHLHRPAGAGPKQAHSGAHSGAHSASQWSELLRRILDEERVLLYAQEVRHSASGEIRHHEILPRIVDDDGSLVPAAVFIPMAKRLGLIRDFDRFVVRTVMARLRSGNGLGGPLAINLFPASIGDADFLGWLSGELAAAPEIAAQLIFEVSEYGAVENPAALRTWVQRLRAAGAGSGIDHFGKGFASFGYLCDTGLDFLKLDGSFVSDIAASQEHRFFVESVVRIAHGLDMAVVAESVESPEAAELLTRLGVDGLQGHAIRPPVPWPGAER